MFFLHSRPLGRGRAMETLFFAACRPPAVAPPPPSALRLPYSVPPRPRRAPKFLPRAPRLPPAFCPLRVGKGAEREAESISFQGLSALPSSLRPCYGPSRRPPTFCRAPKFFCRASACCPLRVGKGTERGQRTQVFKDLPPCRHLSVLATDPPPPPLRRPRPHSASLIPSPPRLQSAARQSFCSALPACSPRARLQPEMSKISGYGRDFAPYLFPRLPHAASPPPKFCPRAKVLPRATRLQPPHPRSQFAARRPPHSVVCRSFPAARRPSALLRAPKFCLA